MVKTTLRQLGKRFNSVYMASDFYLACSRRSDSGARAKNKANERAGKNEGKLSEHLDLLEHRATTSAGKPVSILRVVAEKIRPSFLLGNCLVLV